MDCVDHEQEQVIDLESNSQEYANSESVAKAIARPIVSSRDMVKFCHQDRGPDPPPSLEGNNEPKGRSSTNLEWDLRPINPKLSSVSKQNEERQVSTIHREGCPLSRLRSRREMSPMLVPLQRTILGAGEHLILERLNARTGKISEKYGLREDGLADEQNNQEKCGK